MRAFFKVFAWFVGGMSILAAIATGGFWLFLDATAENMCGNQIINSTSLPEANEKVVVFQRDCGATTGFSTQVSILENGEELKNESGNIFTADTEHEKAPSGPGGGPEVKVVVVSGNTIKILHHRSARVFNHKMQWHGVNIEYGNL
jgi:hypothetical protein